MLWNPDLTVEIALLPTSEGGRAGAIVGEWYGCPIGATNAYFDVRFDLTSIHRVEPGTTAVLPAKFLDPTLALPQFQVGREFSIWEGRVIGTGRVLEVCGDT